MSDNDLSLYDNFFRIPTGNVCDCNGLVGALIGIKPVSPGMRFCGRALTVRCDPLDNLPIHKAMSVARPGDVIVASNGGFTDAGMFGEMLALSCIYHEIRGFVTDGAVRDSAELTALAFPVFAQSICPNGTNKRKNTGVYETVEISGVSIHTGDVILGDADGVCVIPEAKAVEVREKAYAKMQCEASMRARIIAGESVAEIIGIADRL